jgi:hypothetical protein
MSKATLVTAHPLIYLKRYRLLRSTIPAMSDPSKPTEDKEAKPSLLDEAGRVIEEYAADLREIIRKLTHKLH